MREDGSPGAGVPLVQGEDYYFEKGLMVFTARFLLRRGYCCDQGCRHCPYEDLPERSTDAGSNEKTG